MAPVTALTLSSATKATLFGIMSWRCWAQSEHGIARPATIARTGRMFGKARLKNWALCRISIPALPAAARCRCNTVEEFARSTIVATHLPRTRLVLEQLTLNQRVQGSSPCAPTIKSSA